MLLMNAKFDDIIKNTTTIDLKDYDVGYFKLGSSDKQIFLFPNPGSICLVKLYLITKQQFILIANQINKEFSYSNNDVFAKQSCTISSKAPYGAIAKLGVCEKYDIFCLTNSSLVIRPPAPNKVNLFSEEVKRYFICLKENFPEFSENYLIYYIKSKLRVNERQGDSFKVFLLNESPVAKLKSFSRNNEFGNKKNNTERIRFNQNNTKMESNFNLQYDKENYSNNNRFKNDLSRSRSNKLIEVSQNKSSFLYSNKSNFEHSLMKNKLKETECVPSVPGIAVELSFTALQSEECKSIIPSNASPLKSPNNGDSCNKLLFEVDSIRKFSSGKTSKFISKN